MSGRYQSPRAVEGQGAWRARSWVRTEAGGSRGLSPEQRAEYGQDGSAGAQLTDPEAFLSSAVIQGQSYEKQRERMTLSPGKPKYRVGKEV